MTNPGYLSFMHGAWQRGLDVLRPEPAELERGLALHRELAVCENYGFLPHVWTSRLKGYMNSLRERGPGVVEWHRKVTAARAVAATDDPSATAEYLEALDRAGVCGMVVPANDVGELLEDAVMHLAARRHVCNIYKERLFQATCAEDFEQAKAAGRTGIMFSFVGLPISGAGSMADPDGLLDWVDVWYRLGIRFMHLGYNRRNAFADGCTEVRDGGLSDFGRDLIARLNQTGIVVDVPHSSPNTVFDAVKVAGKPVIATHVGCRAIYEHPRCKSDEELKAIASTGGTVGIVALPVLLGPGSDLNTFLRHVAHAIKTVGADHVAIGTDSSYVPEWPEDVKGYGATGNRRNRVGGWKPEHNVAASLDHIGGSLSWTNWPLFTVGLVRMGLSDAEIEKILGGNLRRVLRECRPEEEAAAARVVSMARKILPVAERPLPPGLDEASEKSVEFSSV